MRDPKPTPDHRVNPNPIAAELERLNLLYRRVWLMRCTLAVWIAVPMTAFVTWAVVR